MKEFEYNFQSLEEAQQFFSRKNLAQEETPDLINYKIVTICILDALAEAPGLEKMYWHNLSKAIDELLNRRDICIAVLGKEELEALLKELEEEENDEQDDESVIDDRTPQEKELERIKGLSLEELNEEINAALDGMPNTRGQLDLLAKEFAVRQ